MRAAAEAGELSYGASFGGEDSPGRRSKREIEFKITISLFTPRDIVMQQECWFMQPLAKQRWRASEHQAGQHLADIAGDASEVSHASLQMSPQDPLKWAATSKDFNPIHVSRMGARLFGFGNVIAHGNHVGALVVEQLCSTKSCAAYRMCWESEDAFSIALKFTQPMVLPAVADTEWQTSEMRQCADFVVKRNGKACIEGGITSP